jgi:hypothetical protein
VHALPPTVFLVFLELAVGGFTVQLWADWERLLSRGFVVTSTLILWGCAALALWVRLTLPFVPAAGALDRIEAGATAGFVALLLVYTALWWAQRAGGRRAVGALAALTGWAALACAAASHGAQLGGLLTLASLVLGALALGGAAVAMVLGHWYLVTPALSTRPLLGMTTVLLVAVALQAMLLPVQLFLSQPPPGGSEPTGVAALLGPYLVAFLLRIAVGIVFPLVLAAMTWQTCRLRAMMSATGLLYIAVSCVLAGEIAAKTLFFLTGVPT